MKLSFIIVNYHSERYLQKCISSIKEKILGVDYETIVVNNDPDIVETRLIASLRMENIKIINTSKNLGFGAGCNAGAKIAQGEILCFLNPDTEIVSGNISDVLDRFDKDDKLAIIGPRLVYDGRERSSAFLSNREERINAFPTQEWCAGKEVTILSTILNNFGYKRDKKIWESKIPVECAWISGAAMFIRKNIFQKLGGFDEKFFMYFEDIDLCKRARLAGYKILYFPDFIIKHFGGGSFAPYQKNCDIIQNNQNKFDKIWSRTRQVFFGAGFLDKKEQKRYYYKSQRYYLRKKFFGK